MSSRRPMLPSESAPHRRRWCLLVITVLALVVSACGGGSGAPAAGNSTSTVTDSGTASNALPGTGRPPVTIGDKNFTEQFVLGQLYTLALQAQGYTVQLNENIGPTSVTMQALRTGALDMYPEYLNTFNGTIAHNGRRYATETAAYGAAQRYAGNHGLTLLTATPFSDTPALGVTVGYAAGNGLSSVADLTRVQRSMVVGGPPEFQQLSPGLRDLERNYGFHVYAFKSMGIGDQYTALNDGTIQVADVGTTDGELNSGDYAVLADPRHTFGYGNAVPVVSRKALAAEGPDFGVTVDRVNALLSTAVIRELNAEVDVAGKDPNVVARTFLETHGVIPPGS
ncbi:MAG TPA: glycine betaine ABC transporter substrate-binding protein [Solirubrobacteraceae bacterium]|nr:glycine betaine ABC transporter substrate-binding protein [Solirubrobacteraceae bacterium]